MMNDLTAMFVVLVLALGFVPAYYVTTRTLRRGQARRPAARALAPTSPLSFGSRASVGSTVNSGNLPGVVSFWDEGRVWTVSERPTTSESTLVSNAL